MTKDKWEDHLLVPENIALKKQSLMLDFFDFDGRRFCDGEGHDP